MKKIITSIAVLLLIAVVGGGVYYYFFKPAKIIYPPIKIGVQDSIISAPIVLAQAKDFFTSQGLLVEIKKYPSSKLALEAMFKGEIDIATVTDMSVVSDSFIRNDFSIFATIATTGNGAWITARKDKGIIEPADLKGKKIATQQNSAVHFFLYSFLLYNLIDINDVQVLFMSAVDLPQALVDGKIDAFSMRDPQSREVKRILGEDNVVEFFIPDIYLQTLNLVSKNVFIKNNTDLVQSFTKAIMETENFMETEKDEAIFLTADELNYGLKNETKKVWSDFDFRIGLNQSLLLTLEDMARWWVKENKVNKSIPNYLDYIYIDALEVVRPDVVTIIR